MKRVQNPCILALFGLFLAVSVHAAAFDAVINEMSQGNGGSKEWVEILVLTEGLDMSGWELGDNDDGNFSSFSTFSSHPNWQSVACGTLIVIYNASDRDTILPADDTDFGDKVVVIPHNDATYFSASGNFSFGNSDRDDCAALRDGSDSMVHDMAGAHPTAQVGSPSTGNAKMFMEDSAAEIFTDGNWSQVSAGSATPGAGNGGNNTAWVTACTPPGPQPPTISLPSSQNGVIGVELNFAVTATEPDGDLITLTATNLPAGATFTPTNNNSAAAGTFSFTPSYAATTQTFTVYFTASDADGDDSGSVVITVPPPQPPTLSAPSAETVTEGDTLAFSVTGSEPDGDFVTLYASNLPSGASFTPTNGVSFSSGTFSYTPSMGLSGSVFQVTFMASDTDGSDVKTVTINVQGAGDVPPVPIAFFNEIRGNDESTDDNEFIELVAPAGVDLQGFYIVHFNGSDSSDGELFRFTFPSYIVPNDGVLSRDNVPIGFITIGTALLPSPDFLLPSAVDNLQNGPDGLVLFDPSGKVIDAIAWEGPGDMADDDPGGLITTGNAYRLEFLSITRDVTSSDTSIQAPNIVSGNDGTGWEADTATPGAPNAAQSSGSIVIATNPPPPISNYSAMSLIGDYNSFAIESNMTLIEDHVWQATLVNENASSNRFKFNANSDYVLQWGEKNQSDYLVPMENQLAEVVDGPDQDIVVLDDLTGFYSFTFNETSLLYTINRGSPDSMGLAGTFNGWDKTPHMTRGEGTTWEITQQIFTESGIAFKFVANDDWNIAYGQEDQNDFDLPVFDTAESGGGAANIYLPGSFAGSYKFTFDHADLSYSVAFLSNGVITLYQDFNRWPSSSSYGDSTFEGWQVFNAYIDSDHAYEGQVCRLRNTTPTGSDLYIQSPYIPSGLGYLEFLYASWDGSPNINFTVDVSPNATNWYTVSTFNNVANTSYQKANITLANETNYYFRIQRGAGNERLLIDNIFFTSDTNLPTVSISNLRTDPITPWSNDTPYVLADIEPIQGAQNLSGRLFFRTTGNTNDPFFSITMSEFDDPSFRSDFPLPAQPIGTVVDYYIEAYFEGVGLEDGGSVRFPASGYLSYGIPRIKPGLVWINEINYMTEFFDFPISNQFFEIAGPATTDLSDWSIELVDLNDALAEAYTTYDTYPIASSTILSNDNNGFGFFVVGQIGIAERDLLLTNNLSDHRIGGIRLLNEFGGLEHAISYDGFAGGLYDYASGIDNDFFGGDNQSINLVGGGIIYDQFTWVVNEPPSPGAANSGTNGTQEFVLIPIITCSNLRYQCTNDMPEPSSLVGLSATGTCGDLTAELTFIGPATNNSGMGCAEDPLYIYRTYEAVSDCFTTSRCTQVITIIDTQAPSVTEGNIAFSPQNLDNLKLWLDASDPSNFSLSGTNVTTWFDGSSESNHLSQTNADKKPAYAAAGLNNQGAVLFDGLDDALGRGGALGISNNPALTILTVSRLSNSNRLLTIGGFDGEGQSLQFAADSSWQFNGDQLAFTNAPIGNNAPHIAVWQKPLNGEIEDCTFTRNGIAAQRTSPTNEPLAYFDGFETMNITAGGWVAEYGDYEVQTFSVYSGSFSLRMKRNAALQTAISTVGYGNVKVSYARQTKGYEPGESLFLEAWNGTNWVTLEETSDSSWAVVEVDTTADMWNNPNFKIRVRTVASSGLEYGIVDDVTVSASGGVTINVLNTLTLLGAGYTEGQNAASLDSFAAGIISEVIVYDRELDSDELDLVGYYLEKKWGLNTAYLEPESSGISIIATNCETPAPDYTALVTSSDNCGSPTVTQDPAPGSTLSAGEHTIYLDAVDACSNKTTFTFDILVVGTNPPTISDLPAMTTECHQASIDNASYSTYVFDGWQTGDNGGEGWNPTGWVLAVTDAGNSGHFIGDSRDNGFFVDSNGDGDINSVGVRSWALWAHSGNTADAYRRFDDPLWNGHTFSLNMDNGLINGGGYVGFTLLSATSGTTRLTFGFTGGDANYSVFDAGGKRDIGLPFTDEGVSIRIRLTSADSYEMQVTRLVDDSFTSITGLFAGASGTAIDQVRLFNNNAGAGPAYDLFFNSLAKDPVPPPEPKSVSATSGCSALTISYDQDVSVGTCPETLLRVYRAIDEFGNYAETTQRIIVADTTAPILTCSTDVITITKGPTPDFTTNAVAVDACDELPAFSQSPDIGEIIDEGTQTVFVIATDACGNSSTCSVTVIVVNPPPEVDVVDMYGGPQVTVKSTGTNTINWAPVPVYTTNLITPNWIPIPVVTNVYSNGTNVLIFAPPTDTPWINMRILNSN